MNGFPELGRLADRTRQEKGRLSYRETGKAACLDHCTLQRFLEYETISTKNLIRLLRWLRSRGLSADFILFGDQDAQLKFKQSRPVNEYALQRLLKEAQTIQFKESRGISS